MGKGTNEFSEIGISMRRASERGAKIAPHAGGPAVRKVLESQNLIEEATVHDIFEEASVVNEMLFERLQRAKEDKPVELGEE